MSVVAAASFSRQAPDTTRPAVLAPVTVTAERERALPPPVSTIVAGPAVVQRLQAANGYDLVRRATGIEVHEQGQGPGFASDAVIRGFTSDHSSDVLLTIDGVPINSPVHGHVEGYADWSILSAPALQSLRVLHGPASPYYGDFAFGGVVEAFTTADEAGTVAATFGSSERDGGLWIRSGRRSSDGGAVASFEGHRDQGWRDHADSWLGTAVARGWRRAGAGRLEGGLLLYGSRWDSPGFVSVARYNADDLRAAQDTTDGGDSWRAILHARYGVPLGERATVQILAWSQLARQQVFLTLPEDGVLQQSEERDRRIGFGGQLQLTRQDVAGGELAVGADARGDASRYDRGHTDARAPVAPEIADDGSYVSGAVFARWRRLVGFHLMLDLGARLDGIRYGSLDRLAASSGWRHGTSVQAGPKLGARWLLGSSGALLASFSRGFRGSPGVVGDPTRAPMVVWASELGAEVQRERFHARVAAFHLAVSNERLLNPVTLVVTAQGRSRRQGLWAALEAGLTTRVWLDAEGTLNDARMRDAGSAALSPDLAAADSAVPYTGPFFNHDEPLGPGDPVPGVSRYVGRLGIEYRHAGSDSSGVIIALRSRVGGPFTPIGESTVRTRPYVLFDLEAALPLGTSGARLDLELQNVLNAKYVEIRASEFINPGTPRLLRASLRLPLSH